MPGFAKFMAFMNVAIACVFLFLATKDFNTRRPWAYDVFRSELDIHGLPLDQKDSGPRRVAYALWQDLEPDTLSKMFANAGGNPVKGSSNYIKTQMEEVERLRDQLTADLEKLKDEEDKRARLRDIFLPLALTLEERDYWAQRINDKDLDQRGMEKLQKDLFDDYFGRALSQADTVAPEMSDWLAQKNPKAVKPEEQTQMDRRQRIAHLLYNLGRSAEEHTRTMVVIGLKAYIAEAESQAARLREMSLRVRLTMLDERSLFEVEYTRLTQRILALVEEIERKKYFYTGQQDIKKRAAELVKIRQADLEELNGKLGKAAHEIDLALQLQRNLEERLFETQKQLGEAQEKTQEMERFIRGLEVPNRR
jgi:hypothetical protein